MPHRRLPLRLQAALGVRSYLVNLCAPGLLVVGSSFNTLCTSLLTLAAILSIIRVMYNGGVWRFATTLWTTPFRLRGRPHRKSWRAHSPGPRVQ